jgi:hydroxymethylglutaryl-CoA synthase
VLDVASPGDMILITSFGSGAGSDSFVIKATDLLPAARNKGRTVRSMLDENKNYLTYGQYAAMREKIRMNDIV